MDGGVAAVAHPVELRMRQIGTEAGDEAAGHPIGISPDQQGRRPSRMRPAIEALIQN